tara:strand:+ start:4225 stop:4986 length:762 start_codon:yes stop_codon:yes gene_type:complete
MPTAESFTALGAGNGFASCLTKIDVSDKSFDKWTTLGGNQKGGAVTESGKGLAQAMQFLWNLEGFKFSASASASRATFGEDPVRGGESVSASLTDYSTDADSSEKIVPRDRVCGSLRDQYENDSDVDAPLAASVTFSFSTNNGYNQLARYYNGVTSNEDNFVGYGFMLDTTGFGQDQEIAVQAITFNRTSVIVSLASGSYSTNSQYCSISSNIGFTFYFVCGKDGTSGSDSYSSGGTTAQASASFSRLDFYTY